MANLASADIFSSVGGVLTGIAEILGLVGAGIGFLIRSRRNAHRERERTEIAATLAATEAKKQLEARLERQNASLIQQYRDQLDDQEKNFDRQVDQLKQQVDNLTRDRDNLLTRLLDSQSKEQRKT